MKRFPKVIALMLILTMCLFGCNAENGESSNISSESSAVSDNAAMATPGPMPNPDFIDVPLDPENKISVVVLGDSIARGYGLENVEGTRFSSVLGDSLSSDYDFVTTVNYGVDGLTGAQLVEQLKNQPPKELETCDYVLISIGGNNVLGKLTSLGGVSDLMNGLEPSVFEDYFRYLMAVEESEKEIYEYSCEAISNILKTANNAFGGEGFSVLAKNAAFNLRKELPQITELIKGINPNARIIVQTVYNPYKGMLIRLEGVEEELNMDAYGEQAVSGMNLAIKSLSQRLGYEVAPVHDSFETTDKMLTNAGFDLSKGVFGFDPHPNAEGHKLIGNIYYKMIMEDRDA